MKVDRQTGVHKNIPSNSIQLSCAVSVTLGDGAASHKSQIGQPQRLTFSGQYSVAEVSAWSLGLPPRYASKPTRSTQPCITLGSLNWVLALIGLGKNGNITSVRVADNAVWSHMAWVPIVVRHATICQYPVTVLTLLYFSVMTVDILHFWKKTTFSGTFSFMVPHLLLTDNSLRITNLVSMFLSYPLNTVNSHTKTRSTHCIHFVPVQNITIVINNCKTFFPLQPLSAKLPHVTPLKTLLYMRCKTNAYLTTGHAAMATYLKDF